MMSDRLDKIIAVGFLFVLVFTVLAHGTIEPWSVGIFELLMTLLILLWVIKIILDKQVKLKLPLTALPLAAFLIYGIIQSISWSGNAGQIVSLSQDVESTQSSVLLLFFLFIGHIIAANFFHTQERVKTLINFFGDTGFIVSNFCVYPVFYG